MLTDPRYRAFGAFRFLLALTVVVSHSAWMLSGTGPGDAISGARLGSSAVLGFFVPSGFIMSEAAASFYAGRPSAFARNRGLKIFPAFGAALLLSVLVHLALFSSGLLLAGVAFEGYGSEPKDVFSTGNLLFNSASALPFISSERAREILGSGVYLFVRYIWAVKVEVAFYLTVLLFIASQSVQRVLSKHLAWALVIFSALYTWNGFTAPFCYELQFAPYFLLGIGLYLADRRRPTSRLVLGFGAALSLLHALSFTGPRIHDITLKSMASVLLFGMFVLCMPALGRFRMSLARARLDRKLGDLSYSLYLNHYAVLVAFAALTPAHMRTATWPFVLITAVVVSAVMQYMIERPISRLRDRLRGWAILPDAGPAAVLEPAAASPPSPAE